MKKESTTTRSESMDTSKEPVGKNIDRERSWAERNGALIFLILVFGLIGLAVLYEALFQ